MVPWPFQVVPQEQAATLPKWTRSDEAAGLTKLDLTVDRFKTATQPTAHSSHVK